MNKIFCVSCGHKNLYEVSKPKFCAGCGNEIGVGPSVSAVEKVLKPKMDVELEEETKGSYNLRKLRSQIVAENTSNKIKLGDIVGSASPENQDEFKRDASNLPDGRDLLEQNKKDCGSSRITDIDG
jgi:hypothetical protein